MVGRQLKEEEYSKFLNELMHKARSKSNCPIYEVDINFDGVKYTLFFQQEKRRTVYILYAVYSVYEKEVDTVKFHLITNNAVLLSLMNMIIYQGIKMT